MFAIRRHSMAAVRLLGVGVLFAIALPQHGTGGGRPDLTPPSVAAAAAGVGRGDPARAAAQANDPKRALGAAALVAESPRLRALRTHEPDLFKNLPDAPPCEGKECRGERADGPSGARAGHDDDAFFANLRMPEIPVKAHERVKQYIEYFTQNSEGRRVFRAWLKRSGRYNKAVTGALRELLLPQDLQAVVFVESGFSPKAVSSAGAVGLWQFMAETARVYGLAVETDLDERRSVERSSQAAVRFLADMRDRLGSWELALAAYNMGYKGLTDRIKDVSTNDFWTLSDIDGVLPRETVLYVPKVLATAVILRNLDRFGLDDTRVDPAIPTSDIEVPSGTSLAIVARASGTSIKSLRDLNPELLSDVVPDRGRTYAVHVPANGAARAHSLLPRLLDQRDRDGLEQVATDDFDWGRDEVPRRNARVRRYDPYADDRRDGRDDRDVRDRDAGRDREPPEPSRRVRTPRALPFAQGNDEDKSAAAADRNVILYRVGESESVTGIARTFGTTSGQIIEDNYLDPDGKLQKGMLLIVEVSIKSMTKIMKKRASSRLEEGTGEARIERAESDAPPPPKPQPRTHLQEVPGGKSDREANPAPAAMPLRKAREFFSDDMRTNGWRG